MDVSFLTGDMDREETDSKEGKRTKDTKGNRTREVIRVWTKMGQEGVGNG